MKNILKLAKSIPIGGQRKEMILFILVMLVFTSGMIFLIIVDISNWWVWCLYFIIWTHLELKIAKNIKLKWGWWLLIISALLIIDYVVLELFGK